MKLQKQPMRCLGPDVRGHDDKGLGASTQLGTHWDAIRYGTFVISLP